MILWNLIGDDRTIIEAVQKLLSGQGGFNAQHIEKAEFKSTRFQYLQLFAQADIDGGLVGGASLKPEFGDIVNYKK